MTDIHTCSYYCHRPACIKAQRDELRDKMERERAIVAMGEMIGQAVVRDEGLMHQALLALIPFASEKSEEAWAALGAVEALRRRLKIKEGKHV